MGGWPRSKYCSEIKIRIVFPDFRFWLYGFYDEIIFFALLQ